MTPNNPNDADVLREIGGKTRRSFLTGGVAAALGVGGIAWLRNASDADGVPWPLRRMLEFNEAIGQAAFSSARLAPTFPAGWAATGEDMRVNGMIGLSEPANLADWRLRVLDERGREARFTLEQIQALPRTTMVTELKCIEGWSQVMSFTGVSLRDFMRHYRLGTRDGSAFDLAGSRSELYRHVALETPGRDYYVGLDMASALHPQTLLCYEMGGEPLTPAHGAPLRLAIPVKYGIKNIKRIGMIRFTDARPADYWAERGYDWYAGH